MQINRTWDLKPPQRDTVWAPDFFVPGAKTLAGTTVYPKAPKYPYAREATGN